MEKIVVLGLGNVLYGDEGFGVRVVERLHANYEIEELQTDTSHVDSVLSMADERDHTTQGQNGAHDSSAEASAQKLQVEIIDGGVESDFIPNIVNDIDKLLIVYTANYGQKTGTVTSEKTSDLASLHEKVQSEAQNILHDTSYTPPFHTVLKALIENMESQDKQQTQKQTVVHTISLQPTSMQYGEGLSPNALASLDNASAMAAHVLEKWGVQISAKESSLFDVPSLALFKG